MPVPGEHHLAHPDQLWDVVLGSGYRATVDALSPRQRAAARRRVLARLRSDHITALRTGVIFGTARKAP